MHEGNTKQTTNHKNKKTTNKMQYAESFGAKPLAHSNIITLQRDCNCKAALWPVRLAEQTVALLFCSLISQSTDVSVKCFQVRLAMAVFAKLDRAQSEPAHVKLQVNDGEDGAWHTTVSWLRIDQSGRCVRTKVRATCSMPPWPYFAAFYNCCLVTSGGKRRSGSQIAGPVPGSPNFGSTGKFCPLQAQYTRGAPDIAPLQKYSHWNAAVKLLLMHLSCAL